MAAVSFDRIACTICDRRVFAILLVLLVSIVMAETKLKLDFPDEFYNKRLSDSEFNRRTQSQNNPGTKTPNPGTKARQWPEHTDEPSRVYRWKGIEFHHVDNNEQHPSRILDSFDKLSAPQTDLKPQFEFRF
ncbi:hypothetical protein W03_14540 [Nitrosomonas sp. PY1]|uniref:hypothetical protein n=1 Tax=Nitrosomonas sp. PY1 TaxID=1803906 RepID=UPI001FC7C994|nr:hypothetical protein [Nitrosomonas sp. PY1]GKS69450.1 hypothetical protein W03_14540 [Nitrosomonas sp. PY1]